MYVGERGIGDKCRHRGLKIPTVGAGQMQQSQRGEGFGDRAPTKRRLIGSRTECADDDRLTGIEEYDAGGRNVTFYTVCLDAMYDVVPSTGLYISGRYVSA